MLLYPIGYNFARTVKATGLIVDRRPRPPSPAERQHLLQPEDVAEVVLLMASLPPQVNVALVSMVQTVG